MKQKLLLKSLFLLFALIAGSTSVWADDILNEPFNIAGTDPVSSSYNGWTVSRCWGGDGSIRLGASSGDKGQLITPALTALSGGATLTFEVKKYGTDSGSIGITVEEGSGNVSGDVTVASSSISADSWTTKTVTITGGGSTTKIKFLMTNKRMYLRNVKIVPLSVVNVTGVSLNKTNLTLTVGDSETLTATVAPAEATNKNVSWSSDAEDVATVVGGVVTGVAPGTATITVTTEDGSKTATCNVTVEASKAPVSLDFTSNTSWSFPTSKTEGTNSYTADGYTISLYGPTGQGYYFDTTNKNLLLGKENATLTLPAFPFDVEKIKVYGISSAAIAVTFNVFVGTDAVSTEVTSSKVNHEFEIAADKQAEGTIYVIKVTNDNNMRITKIEIYGKKKVTIASSGYSTLASGYALDFSTATPAGLEAYIAQSVTNSGVNLTAVTEAPASTGLILKGTASTTYTIPAVASAAAVGTNKLHAAVTAYDCAANEVYILQGGKFCLVTDASTVPGGKAYLLASDVPAEAHELTFNFDDETAINALENATKVDNGAIYDLSGRRVENPTKGIYIINGKKVIFK